MLMLYELEVLQTDSETIGTPVPLPLQDIIDGYGNTNALPTAVHLACKGENTINQDRLVAVNALHPYLDRHVSRSAPLFSSPILSS